MGLEDAQNASTELCRDLNHNSDLNCTFKVPLMYMHNPYYGQHLYLNRTIEIAVPPMTTTDWIDAGAMMDTLNHGTWNFGTTKTCGKNYTVEVGVRTNPFDHTGEPSVVPVRGGVFDMRQNDSQMVVDASTRASQRVRHSGADFVDIMASLDAQTPQIHGKPLDVLGLWANTFGGGHFNVDTPAGGGGSRKKIPGLTAKSERFKNMFCNNVTKPNCLTFVVPYTDMRSVLDWPEFVKLNKTIQTTKPSPAAVKVVSMGDEITVRAPGTFANDTTFQTYLRDVAKLELATLGCKSWDQCNTTVNTTTASKHAALFFYSKKYLGSAGIEYYATITEYMRTHGLINARIGANFSPANYIGYVYQWIRMFREKGFSLPWSEDWIWQMPVGTQQMMTLSIDAMRSGASWEDPPSNTVPPPSAAVDLYPAMEAGQPYNRKKRAGVHVEMLMYIMKHFPGNTHKSWKRQLYGDLSHGVTNIDLFDLETSTMGYTCDYVGADGGAYPAVRAALNEVGLFEDIIKFGAVNPDGVAVAILYSESSDIWMGPEQAPGEDLSTGGTLGGTGTWQAAMRAHYIALRHAHIPIDVLIEEDLPRGRLQHYSVLHVLTPQLTTAASTAAAAWVRSGGTLIATAGSGLRNEYNGSNVVMHDLLGIEPTALYTGSRGWFNNTIFWIKQDLAFAEVLDTVTLKTAGSGDGAGREAGGLEPLVVKGAKSVFTVKGGGSSSSAATEIMGTFSDVAQLSCGRSKVLGIPSTLLSTQVRQIKSAQYIYSVSD